MARLVQDPLRDQGQQQPRDPRDHARGGRRRDCFGEGELYATFAGGADPEGVVLNGSNKAYRDMRAAVELGVRVNIDGEDEAARSRRLRTGRPYGARQPQAARVPAAVAEHSSDYIGVGSRPP